MISSEVLEEDRNYPNIVIVNFLIDIPPVMPFFPHKIPTFCETCFDPVWSINQFWCDLPHYYLTIRTSTKSWPQTNIEKASL